MTQRAVTAISSPTRSNSPQSKRITTINTVRNACLGSMALKAVANALAQLTNEDSGDCWPSVQLVSDWTDLSRRAVQMNLRQLEKRGAIHAEGSRRGGRQQTTHYRLNLGWFEARARQKNEPIKGAPHSPITDVNSAPRSPFKDEKGASHDIERAHIETLKGASGSPKLYRVLNKKETTTTEEAVPNELREGLKAIVPAIDQKAVGRLWKDCRAKSPDCTVSEVIGFARTINLDGKHSPVGFLLTVVPNCFEEDSLKDFRERQTKRKLTKLQMAEEAITEQNDCLADLNTYREAMSSLDDMPADVYEQKRREYIKLVPNAISWSPDVLDRSLRAYLIRQ